MENGVLLDEWLVRWIGPESFAVGGGWNYGRVVGQNDLTAE